MWRVYDEIYVVYLSKHEALMLNMSPFGWQFDSAFDQFANLGKLSLAKHGLFVCYLSVI